MTRKGSAASLKPALGVAVTTVTSGLRWPSDLPALANPVAKVMTTVSTPPIIGAKAWL
jgi:hypothetical protein